MSATSEVRQGSVPTGGTRLAWHSMGEGAPVVVVHGGPGLGHAYLRPAMDVLADRVRVIYYDQRGSGSSEVGDPTRMTLPGAVEDLEALRTALHLERLNLLGHSYGADLALLYAERHPDRVTSLVVANPGPPFTAELQEDFGQEYARRFTAEDQEAIEAVRTSEPFRSGDPGALEEYYRVVFRPFFRDPQATRRLRLEFTPITAGNILGLEERLFESVGMLEPVANLSAVDCPTLVIHAELDPLPEAFSRLLAERIPDARFRLLEGVGHFAYLEDPDRFFAAVLPFLEQHAQ